MNCFMVSGLGVFVMLHGKTIDMSLVRNIYIYMTYDINKYPKTYRFMDHPSELGYIVYEE